MHDPAVQTINLTKRYGSSTALQDVNLEVPKESIFAVLGPNGAGKTSLFMLLAARVFYRIGLSRLLKKDF